MSLTDTMTETATDLPLTIATGDRSFAAVCDEAPPLFAATRRQVLVAAGVGAGAIALVACGSSTPAGSASPAAAPSTTKVLISSAAAAGGANGTNVLAALSSVPVGGAIAATDSNGKPIIVAQPTAGHAVAFSAICTHKSCAVKPAGKVLDCPCHGSSFDAFTGAVLGGPAPSPLPAVSVAVEDGNVVLG